MIRKKTQSQTTDTPMSLTMRKSHATIIRQQEEKKSNASISLLPIEIIVKLKWTQSNVQQNIEQLQNPLMGVKIDNKSSATEPLP